VAGDVVPKVILPWAYQSNSGRTRVASLERLVNLLPEATNKAAMGTHPIVVTSAPGSRPFSNLSDDTEVNQLYSLAGRLFAWTRKAMYEIQDNGHATAIFERNFGRDISVSDGVNYTDAGFRLNQMWFSDRGEVFIFDLQTNQTTRMADIERIGDQDLRRVGNVTHLNNYAIFRNSDSDQFQWSDLADFDSVNALSFATAESASDITVHIEAFEGDLLHFGETRLEVWRATGDQDTPFAPLTNASIEIGCANGRTVKRLTRDIYWVSDDLRVYRTAARSYQAVPISLHQGVEHDLFRYGAGNAFAYVATLEGHSLYHLVIPEANRTWVYDEQTQLWHERSTINQCRLNDDLCDDGGYGKHLANSSVMHNGKCYIGGTGKVFLYDLDYFEDDEQPILREASTSPITSDWDGAIHRSVSLEFQNNCREIGERNEVLLQHSNDLGRTWVGSKPRPLVREKHYTPTWRNLGRGLRRAYRWRSFYNGQIVFWQSQFDIDGVSDGRN